jgi:hypothetical protein
MVFILAKQLIVSAGRKSSLVAQSAALKPLAILAIDKPLRGGHTVWTSHAPGRIRNACG